MYKAFSIILFLVFVNFTYSQYVNDTLNVSLNRYSDTLQDNNKLFIDFLNPFCPSTETRFNIPEKCESKFTLIDSSGVLIAILFDKELELGQYSLFWNISGMKSDMYICFLTAGDYIDKRKFFLVR